MIFSNGPVAGNFEGALRKAFKRSKVVVELEKNVEGKEDERVGDRQGECVRAIVKDGAQPRKLMGVFVWPQEAPLYHLNCVEDADYL